MELEAGGKQGRKVGIGTRRDEEARRPVPFDPDGRAGGAGKAAKAPMKAPRVSAAMAMIDLFVSCRRLGAAVLLAGAAAMTPAHAQTVAAFVNGEPITALDVEQR